MREGRGAPQQDNTSSPLMKYYVTPCLLAFSITGASIALCAYFYPHLLPLYSYLLGINISSFFLMLIDKSHARLEKARVPEIVLYLLVALGGGIGVLTGMHRFKHKTRKVRFQLVVIGVILTQLMLCKLYVL